MSRSNGTNTGEREVELSTSATRVSPGHIPQTGGLMASYQGAETAYDKAQLLVGALSDQRGVHYSKLKTASTDPSVISKRKWLRRLNFNSLIPEVPFLLYAVLSGSLAFVYAYTAYSEGALPADDEIKGFEKNHPYFMAGVYTVNFVVAFLDWVNNLLLVTPTADAEAQAGYWKHTSLFEFLMGRELDARSKEWLKLVKAGALQEADDAVVVNMPQMSVAVVDGVDQADGFTPDVRGQISAKSQEHAQTSGRLSDDLSQFELSTIATSELGATGRFVTRLLAADISFVTGSLGDLVPFVVKDATLPAFLAYLVFSRNKSPAEWVALSILSLYFSVSGYTYYRMYCLDDIMDNANRIKSGVVNDSRHLFDKNNVVASLLVYKRLLMASAFRAAGFGFIGANVFGSANSFGDFSQYKAEIFWSFFLLGGFFNTFIRSLGAELNSSIGTAAEQAIGDKEYQAGQTYAQAVDTEIAALSFVAKNKGAMIHALPDSFGFAALLGFTLYARQNGALVISAATIGCFLGIFLIECYGGLATERSQRIRAKFYRHQHETLSQTQAHTIDPVKERVAVLREESQAVDDQQQKQIVNVVASQLTDQLVAVQDATNGALAKLQRSSFGVVYADEVTGKGAARKTAQGINLGSAASRCFMNIAFGTILCHVYFSLDDKASISAATVFAVAMALNGLMYNAQKTDAGWENFAKWAKRNCCVFGGGKNQAAEESQRLLGSSPQLDA